MLPPESHFQGQIWQKSNKCQNEPGNVPQRLFILYAEDRDLLPVRDSRYDEYGLRELGVLAESIIGSCERAMRAAIRELPDGEYQGKLETDGLAVPITLKMKLDGVTVNPQLDQQRTVALFGRPRMADVQTYDLARGLDAGPSGLRQTRGYSR